MSRVDGAGQTAGEGDGGRGAATGLPRTKKALGALLSVGRTRAGLSYRDLSRRSGVPTGTLQGWLAGRSLPTPALRGSFLGLVDLLGVTDGYSHEQWWDAVEQARRIPGTGAGNPYVGLRPYAPEDRELFFGREDELAELARRVREAAAAGPGGVVALLAPSGGGKSSLLGAGLVGTACADGGALEGWYGAIITPGEDPEARWRGATTARRDFPTMPAVLVVDQFEELWTVATPEQRAALLAGLAAYVAGPTDTPVADTSADDEAPVPAAPTVVVLGLRSDYFGPAAEIEALAPSLGRAMLLRTVNVEQAERIITGPARLRGVTVDPGLVAVLQRDLSLGDGPWAGGALPLLSQAMTETWDKAPGPTLTVADYLAVGGVAGAIDRTAERAYADLDEAERATARALLLRLVRVDLDTPVRRPLELALLTEERAWAVVERFARARLLTVGDDNVEIAHEALLQHWGRLRDWVVEDMEDLRAQAYLGRAAALWAEHDRDDDLLVPAERFGLGLEDAGASERMLGSVERSFVAASRAHFTAREEEQLRVNRRLRRRSRAALSAFAVAMVLAILAGVALINMLTTRNEALSRQTSLSSSLVAAQDPGLAAQVALGASELATTPEGTSALVTATGRPLPRRALGLTQPTKLAVDTTAGLLAQPGSDGSLRLWRGAAALGDADGTPETVALDPGHGYLQIGAVAPAGGRLLVAAGGAAGVWLVDVTTAPSRVLATLATGIGTTYGLVFAPDGRTLYAAGQDGVVRRWDVTAPDSPRQLAPVDGQAGVTYALAVNPAGTRLVAAGAKGVSRWALDGGTPTALPALTTERVPQAVAYAPDGRSLVAGARSDKVYRWTLDGDTAVSQPALTGFGSWINDVHFSPDGTRVLVASSDQTMREYDAATGSQVHSYPHPAVVSAALYDGDHLVSAASDGAVRWWPRTDPEIGHFASSLFQVSSDPSGTRLLATVERKGGVGAWDLTDPAHPLRLTAPDNPTGGAVNGKPHSPVTAVIGDGSGVLTGTSAGDVVVWIRRGDGFGPGVVVPIDPGQDISWLGSSADGSTVLASSYTSTKAFVLKRTGDSYAVTASMDVQQPQSMALSADGHLAVIADSQSAAGVWTLDDQGRVTGTATMSDLGSVATASVLSPDARSVAIGTDAGQVVVYDLTKPAAPRRVMAERTALGAIYGLTVSPDGKYLAAGAGDNRIWVWRWTPESLTLWAWIEASLDRVNDVRFIDGGHRLVGVGANGIINSWDTDLTRARRTVCQGRGAPLTADEWAERLVGAAPRELC